MPTHLHLPVGPSFPTDHRDLDAPHRKLLAPLADLLAAATEAAHAANDAPTAARLDQAWLLVVAAVVDTGGEVRSGSRTARSPPCIALPCFGRSGAASVVYCGSR